MISQGVGKSTNTVRGFSFNRTESGNDRLDRTEGIGAFLDILSLLENGDKNLDIGGGKYDDNTEWLNKFGIQNYVMDPFQRSLEHNVRVLGMGRRSGGFDSVSLMSVLNVIPGVDERLKVLRLARTSLKDNGRLFIKIWKGPGTDGTFQMNKDTTFYLDEVREIFPNAVIHAESFIFARK